MKHQKGFTVVELLTVIAVIALLTTVVLVVIRSRTESAKDARVETEMAQLRIVAAMYEVKNKTYDGLEDNTEADAICTDINEQLSASNQPVIHTSVDRYCIYADLNLGDYFCIDSTGVANNFVDPTVSCTGADAAHFHCSP